MIFYSQLSGSKSNYSTFLFPILFILNCQVNSDIAIFHKSTATKREVTAVKFDTSEVNHKNQIKLLRFKGVILILYSLPFYCPKVPQVAVYCKSMVTKLPELFLVQFVFLCLAISHSIITLLSWNVIIKTPFHQHTEYYVEVQVASVQYARLYSLYPSQ